MHSIDRSKGTYNISIFTSERYIPYPVICAEETDTSATIQKCISENTSCKGCTAIPTASAVRHNTYIPTTFEQTKCISDGLKYDSSITIQKI